MSRRSLCEPLTVHSVAQTAARPPNSGRTGEIATRLSVIGDILGGMIIGSHFLLYSKDADADRAFFHDVLGFDSVDAGEGWLIFAMSPAEMAVHPLEGEFSQNHAGHRLLGAVLYLMCDDLETQITSLTTKNIRCSDVETAGWGRVTTVPLPSGGRIGLYQPRHATALHLKSR